MIVVDASVLTHALAVESNDGPVHAKLADQAELHAPHLIELEVLAAIRGLTRGGHLSTRAARACIGDLSALPMVLYPHGPLMGRMWALRDNLTVYDAAYVALAEALNATLVTADKAVAACPGLRCQVEVF